MIEEKSYKDFAENLRKNVTGMRPLSAQIELTYRCNLSCVHCYCLGCGDGKELDIEQWKQILDQLHTAGTIFLTITGGEPLLRDDFFDIYTYAKTKGFLISLFTNGVLWDDKTIKHLIKYSPYSIEISLYGLTNKVFESITGVTGSFLKIMQTIDKVVDAKLPLVLKTVGLKQNKDHIHDIKAFARNKLGKGKFKFDSFIIPKLDGDKTPCQHRLSPKEILDIEEGDDEMMEQREEEFRKHKPSMREPEYKYHCNSWFNQFYITPNGALRFCHISEKHSSDLTMTSFEEGFYEKFPAILNEQCTFDSKCIKCELREYCYHCPARAFLETGDEEAPVPYYCELAEMKKTRELKAMSGT